MEEIALANKSTLDGVIYLFSFLGFALLPAGLGRKIWWVVLWFFLLNVVFLLGIWDIPVWQNGMLFTALTLWPALLFLFLLGRRQILAIPLKEFLLFNLFRVMGVHFILAIVGGYAPQTYALEVGFSEILTGLSGLALLTFYRPQKNGYLLLLLFWNGYGVTSVSTALFKTFFANPYLRLNFYTPEIYHYLSGFPQNWVHFFWFPLALAMHLALFYRILAEQLLRRDGLSGPGETRRHSKNKVSDPEPKGINHARD